MYGLVPEKASKRFCSRHISLEHFGYFSTSVILSVFGCLPAMSGRHDVTAPALAAADLSDADASV